MGISPFFQLQPLTLISSGHVFHIMWLWEMFARRLLKVHEMLKRFLEMDIKYQRLPEHLRKMLEND